MYQYYSQPKKSKKWWVIIPALIIIAFFSLFFLKTSFTISKVTDWKETIQDFSFAHKLPPLPEKDSNRINILLLGIRGPDDPGDGKFLSDAMIVASIDKEKNQAALISLPRDLYVQTWCVEEKRKINFAYAQGGLDCAKKTVAITIGLYIDYAISVDFRALEEGIDALGGITIYLDETFEEDFQWSKEGWEQSKHWFIKEIDGEERWVFQVPAGKNHLDGKTALYYVRSRYSTNDFDRMRRQQQVLMAIKDKALSLGVLANPVKIYNILDIVGKHFRTDISLKQMDDLIKLAMGVEKDNLKELFFDDSPQGLLYNTFVNEEYVLLPVGDSFDKIQEECRDVFDF